MFFHSLRIHLDFGYAGIVGLPSYTRVVYIHNDWLYRHHPILTALCCAFYRPLSTVGLHSRRAVQASRQCDNTSAATCRRLDSDYEPHQEYMCVFHFPAVKMPFLILVLPIYV